MITSLADAQAAILNYKKNHKARSAKHTLIFLRSLKAEAILDNNQLLLNEIRYWIYLLQAQEYYLSAFENCIEGTYYKAWCDLELAEVFLERLPVVPIEEISECISFIKDRIDRLQKLFPYRAFCSPEFTFKRKCSICDSYVNFRKKCEHKVGQIYDGKLCKYDTTDFDFLGVALVENPVQKYSVMFAIDADTGKRFDHYSYPLLDFLFTAVRNPFEDWSCSIKSKRKPISDFSHIEAKAKCPCDSGAEFKDCCQSKEYIEFPHYQFDFTPLSSQRMKRAGDKWKKPPPQGRIGDRFEFAIFHTTHEDLA